MVIKMRVIKGRDTSYTGKNGRVERYALTCADPEETLLDNVDVIIPTEFVARVGVGASAVKGKVLKFTVETIREGLQRIEIHGVPELPGATG